jgi:hypothetical protein
MHADRSLEAEDIRFDGELLYRRKIEQAPLIIWASRFSKLSIAGLLEVRSPVLIDLLVLKDNCCEMVFAASHAGGLQITTREGVQLIINGQSASIGRNGCLLHGGNIRQT